MIEEQSVRLKLTVTDTPGFGDQINNDKWYAFTTNGLTSTKHVLDFVPFLCAAHVHGHV